MTGQPFPEEAPAPKPASGAPSGVAALSLTYREGRPVLVMGEGTTIPGGITVENVQGEPIAHYTAGPPVRTTRIVGGAPATPHEFPWMVDLR